MTALGTSALHAAPNARRQMRTSLYVDGIGPQAAAAAGRGALPAGCRARRARGSSVAAVIREAIDRGLPTPDQRRRAAARRVLDAEPVEAPEVPDLLVELEELRSPRA
jgi:hypothetical protein